MKDSIKPVLSAKLTTGPRVLVGRTNVLLENQGYTYNEAGFTYNQAGVMYGGLYEYDIYPIVAKARLDKPSIFISMDFSGTTNITPPGASHTLIGMLGMTYA